MTFSDETLARETAARLNAKFALRLSRSTATVHPVAEGFAVIVVRR